MGTFSKSANDLRVRDMIVLDNVLWEVWPSHRCNETHKFSVLLRLRRYGRLVTSSLARAVPSCRYDGAASDFRTAPRETKQGCVYRLS